MRICREAIMRLRQMSRLSRLPTSLTSAALLLARAGRLEGASLLLGHVRANLIDFGFEYELGFRDEVMMLTDAEPDRGLWLARGSEHEPRRSRRLRNRAPLVARPIC